MLPLPSTGVIFQKLADGAVLFSTATETYFGLNEVGTRVWELLPPTSSTLDEVCEALGAAYPDAPPATIRQDVTELLDELIREGLAQAPRLPRAMNATPR